MFFDVVCGLIIELEYCYVLLYFGVVLQNIFIQQVMVVGWYFSYVCMQEVLVVLVMVVGFDVVEYDCDWVIFGIGEMQGYVFNIYDEDCLCYFLGYWLQNDVEYVQVCDVMVDLFEYQFNYEYVVDMVWVGLFVGQCSCFCVFVSVMLVDMMMFRDCVFG